MVVRVRVMLVRGENNLPISQLNKSYSYKNSYSTFPKLC